MTRTIEAALYALSGRKADEKTIVLRGLNPGQDFRTECLNDGEATELSGAQLMRTGLRMQLAANTAKLWKIETNN